ncbi:MAG: UDP-N-acetylmuramate--L-alanine ligase [Bacteroidota bacterium]
MKRVIISGGGTGGHIFPAIAIANALKAKVEGIEILFIGARGRMEMEKVPAAGFRIEGLPISGFQRRLTWKNLSFPVKVISSLIRARRIISEFKPDLVIGVGGYASGPTLRMATSMGIPSLIQEQNSFPGVTNRLLGKRVRKICVAYEGMNRYFPEEKLVLTGNPIRQEMVLTQGKREEALKFFGLDARKKTLLVIGGSLGARTINQAILKFVADGGNGNDIQVLWQTGKYYFENINANIPHPVSRIPSLVILPFIDRMDMAYAAADLIVSRAGAIAISELCAVGKPLILVPSPNVSEDHQTKNARALVDKNAALMITDITAVETLGKAILDLFGNPALQADLSAGIKALGIVNSAEKIADVAISLMTHGAAASHPATVLLQPRSVYFLGIGGIGMSALARFFRQQGSAVAGYDRTPSHLTEQMSREGMDIHFTEDISLIPPKPDLVIYTPAIPVHNLEYRFFKSQDYPMRKRAEVLGMISGAYKTIAVAGTHGKTTTSTMIAHMLHTAGIGQIAFLGGVSKNYGTNYLYETPPGQAPATGGSPAAITYCVVEADEYDKSFLQLTPYISIITSADADHLDIYGSHEDLRKTFSAFTARMVTGGSLIIKAGVNVTPKRISDYTVYDYSITGGAAFTATDIRLINGLLHFDFVSPSGTIADLVLGVPGKFNLENAISALAVGTLLGIRAEDLRKALLTYEGVLRRFEVRIRRADLVYIDDYAHHPEELKACIGAVRDLYPGKRITGIFQPHLFTRTRDLADDFARSLEMLDELLLLDIYPARELPIAGIDSQFLLDRVNLEHKKLIGKNNILQELATNKPEILLTLGAGDIDQLAGPITNALSLPA